MKLDKFDREILRVMQRDATISMADLSQKVGLSHTPCWRRVKKMEADGLIRQKSPYLTVKNLIWACLCLFISPSKTMMAIR